MTTFTSRRLLLGAGALLTAVGLAACSNAAPAETPVAKPTSTHTEKNTDTGKDTRTADSTKTKSASGGVSGSDDTKGGGCNDPYPVNTAAAGINGPVFVKAMADAGIPAQDQCTGKATTGNGSTSYTLIGSGNYVVSVTCISDSRGDGQAAQAQAVTFLTTCASGVQYSGSKEPAAAFVKNTVPTVQVGQPATYVAGGVVSMKLLNLGAGSYSLTMQNGG